MRDDGAREYEFVENSGIYHVVVDEPILRQGVLRGHGRLRVRSLCGREKRIDRLVLRDASMRVCAICGLIDVIGEVIDGQHI